VLIEHLNTHALSWEAVNMLWQSEDVGNSSEDGSDVEFGSHPLHVVRRSSAETRPTTTGSQERWSSHLPVHLSGWRRPKKITFVLGQQTGFSLNAANLRGLGTGPCGMGTVEWEDEDDHFEDEDDSSSLDDPSSPFTNYDDGDDGAGVKHDRMLVDPGSGNKLAANDLGSPAIFSMRKSPLCSPLGPPIEMNKVIADMETGAMRVEGLPDDSDFEESMSTEHDYGVASGWRGADLEPDLALVGITGITDLGLLPTDLVLH
jgi:hypothetical protein